jgi:RNA polymerase sigma-70 factor, ECF subfamily
LTSAKSLRLWLIAGPGGDRGSAAARELPADLPADARTGPTVTHSPHDVIEQHLGTVFRYALRLAGRFDLAEDVTQETMLRAWRGRHGLRDPRTVRVWLLRIATNVWTDHLRQGQHRPQSLAAEPQCPRPTPAAVADDQENVRRALAAMDELPPRQRQVLYLVTCEQLSHAEVAQVLEIGISAVKANLSVARTEMRRRLKDVYDQVCRQAERNIHEP